MKLHHVKHRTVCCSALQCVAVRCSALQCVAERKCAPWLFRSHVCALNMPETCPTVTYEWVMSHIWMSHVTHRNESCHASGYALNMPETRPTFTYERVMSHIILFHVTRWNDHVTHMNESCQTYKCVMTHIWVIIHFIHLWMSHITHINLPRVMHTSDIPVKRDLCSCKRDLDSHKRAL